MAPEQLRDAISETFRGKDGARVLFTLLALIHSLVNVASERLRPLLPWEVWFIGNDRNPFRLRFRKRPLGYFLAKLVTFVFLLFVLAFLGEVSRNIVEAF